MNRATLLSTALAITPALLAAQSPQEHRRIHGDTTFVTSSKAAHVPILEATRLRTLTAGPDGAPFGRIDALALGPNGSLAVFDGNGNTGPELSILSPGASALRRIGREGDGPGEYRGGGPGLAIAADGTILLRQLKGVINRYRADGRFINSFFISGIGGLIDIFPGPHHTFYTHAGPTRGAAQFSFLQLPLLQLDSMGVILDTVPAPPPTAGAVDSKFALSVLWTVIPDGRRLALRSDKLGYTLQALEPRASLLRTDVEATPPRFLPEERQELQLVLDFGQRLPPGMRSPITRMPELKQLLAGAPAFDWSQRIWLPVHTAGVKQGIRALGRHESARGQVESVSVSYDEPPEFASFDLSGHYYGRVRFPLGATRLVFFGNTAWGVITGPDDEPALAEFRLPAALDAH
ncbi:MAG: hypothetical protein V4558_08905 [Gemmatimonadota bacterium]